MTVLHLLEGGELADTNGQCQALLSEQGSYALKRCQNAMEWIVKPPGFKVSQGLCEHCFALLAAQGR